MTQSTSVAIGMKNHKMKPMKFSVVIKNTNSRISEAARTNSRKVFGIDFSG